MKVRTLISNLMHPANKNIITCLFGQDLSYVMFPQKAEVTLTIKRIFVQKKICEKYRV